ncbi:aminotransferase class I/II-fold pyridoxal phosphate-dependent enzyme [Aestuariibacter salexigens]|uniref:aminotransferase class I/II-fold pyridoxal phosphate-dependent enzyme n=1 Tax=Aestuariibacter salexigens TaxID=226010 RepID=UPI0003F9E600|nr:aminotransferase class I/II-fold pyridoxal phosphate-dependent enzyme [Aestuariibacter salexigens]
MTPEFKILIIEKDESPNTLLQQHLEGAVQAFRRSDVNITILTIPTVSLALQMVKDDGCIQAIVYNWSGGQSSDDDNATVVNSIKRIRHELPVYVVSRDSEGLDIVNQTQGVEAFFYHSDVVDDPESMLGYLLNDFDDRAETPFWSAYRKYVNESNDSWHTPGHSGGASFRNSSYINDFYQYFGRNVFASDLSVSVDSLGSLSDGTHAIGRAQQLVANTFEVQHSYFVTNGSSTSNKIILQTLLRQGDKVIVDRNCHKSVHYGIIQTQAMPIYLDSVMDPDLGIFAPPRLQQLRDAIQQHPDAKLIVLTGCTYDGLLTDLKQVVELGHQHGMKVFIDEAWFAYSLFHPRFRDYSAIHSGADYITHSAHKVVSAFSQASYIHVNDPDFDKDFFKEIYSIHTSTSPKYQIIASLDVCRKQLEMEGYKLLNELLKNVGEFRQQAAKFKQIKVLDNKDFSEVFSHFDEDNMGHDPLKILIDVSGLGYSNHEIHSFLMDEVGLEIEKFTHSTMLVLLTLGGVRSKIVRLYNALKKLDDGVSRLRRGKQKVSKPDIVPPIELETLPSSAFFAKRESVPWQQSVGRIAAGLVTPYPPGIPLWVPGQRIKQTHINYIQQLASQKLTVQGMYDGEVYVTTKDID